MKKATARELVTRIRIDLSTIGNVVEELLSTVDERDEDEEVLIGDLAQRQRQIQDLRLSLEGHLNYVTTMNQENPDV